MSHGPAWYWHRLRAMNAGEVWLRMQKKFRAAADARRQRDWSSLKLESSGHFPKLPKPEDAPPAVREGLRRDADDILAGRWRAFGHLELKVNDPPKWQRDYVAGCDLSTRESAFGLDHRVLPEGADVKLIWELSRWYQLVRLAMAAYVLDDERSAQKCVRWLEDWVRHNPPYHGWNWTSALESGLRLVQFAWIDALLSAKAGSWGFASELETLRHEILPPHAWFTWRHRSFGSSANNHLIGELAGLIVATVRWPALARWGAPLEELLALWEREVLLQFAPDEGNREQALNYQLFSWEFCWQAVQAIESSGRKTSPIARQRWVQAGSAFWELQARKDQWDYGDSDGGFVVPVHSCDTQSIAEWHRWFEDAVPGSPIFYWLGQTPDPVPPARRRTPNRSLAQGQWWIFPDTGFGLCESGYWWLRWDLSPLGYLSTAAHGHLDALHLSIWLKGVALVIDPGTGCYYFNSPLRNWLASREAHNGPVPLGVDFPRRAGPFLWADRHADPTWTHGDDSLEASLQLPGRRVRRQVRHLDAGTSWEITDACFGEGGVPVPFTVLWQFAPGSWIKRLTPRRFRVCRADVAVEIDLSPDWSEVKLVETSEGNLAPTWSPGPDDSLEGMVSPRFRQWCRAPFLKLTAGQTSSHPLLQTTFRAGA